MQIKPLLLPPQKVIKKHMLSALEGYWRSQYSLVEDLPVSSAWSAELNDTLILRSIALPSWGVECGVEGVILVPAEACLEGQDWQKVNWWFAAFLMLECWHERSWEQKHGPIHSYSFRLSGWDSRAWDYAWVNRIGLFLRAWTAHEQGENAVQMFGPLPIAEITMTHDVDAISKTLAIRIKQCVFNIANAVKCMFRFKFKQSIKKIQAARRFAFGAEDWWQFERLLEQEARVGIKAEFNFYADVREKTFKRWLLDPGYDVQAPKVEALITQIKKAGAVIGLHPSFDAWEQSDTISSQKERLETVCKQKIVSCRQHWLRFSWKKTWQAQEAAGLTRDSTMLFNDRSGFRASAALQWHPWSEKTGQAHLLSELPTVIMDSHLYDYQNISGEKRDAEVKKWVNECKIVGGKIAILWHPHTLTNDYSWGADFIKTLNTIS